MTKRKKKIRRNNTCTDPQSGSNRNLIGISFSTQEVISQVNYYSNSVDGRRIVCFFVGLSAFFVGLWCFDYKLSLSGDNTEFITLARSLVAGAGLQYLNLPEPVPATKYPFGFPLLLALIEWFFPREWIPMKMLVLIIFSFGVGTLYLLLRTRLELLPSLAIVIISITAGKSYLTTDAEGMISYGPILLHFSHQIMSEIPYLVVSLLAVLFLERGVNQLGILKNKAFWSGIVFVMLAYYIRSAGVALIASFFIYLLTRRDIKRACFFIFFCFVAWLPWTIRNNLVGDGPVYLQQLIMVNPYHPERGFMGLTQLTERIAENGLLYLNLHLPRLLWPFTNGGQEIGSVSIFILIISGYTVWKAIRLKRDVFWVFYTAAVLGVAILWPWVDARFLIGVIPFFIYFSARVAIDLADFLKAAGGSWTGRIFIWALSLSLIIGQFPGVMNLSAYARSDYPPVWDGYYSAGKWLDENASSDALIVCRKPYWMYVVSGRKSINFPFKDTSFVFSYLERKKADYIVLESLGFPQTSQYLLPTVQEYPDHFSIVWSDKLQSTFVLGFLQSK